MPIQGTPEPAKRRRVYKGKTRTGCGTCKIRHKKCTEEKPECSVCTSTGRKCNGYGNNSYARSDRRQLAGKVEDDQSLNTPRMICSKIIVENLAITQGTYRERRSIDFFYRRTAPLLTGFIDSEFWEYLLPQMSQSEPTIRHAMIAVGTLHEHLDEGYDLFQQNQKTYDFILRQYNAAISNLRRLLLFSSNEKALEITLLCCILFICLEFLRSDLEAAIAHIESGLQILATQQLGGAQSPGNMNTELSQTPSLIEDHIIPLFNRLDIQTTSSGRTLKKPPIPKVARLYPKHFQFQNFREAREAMDSIAAPALRFIRELYISSYKRAIEPGEYLKVQDLEARFRQWYIAFDELSDRLRLSGMSQKDNEAWMILEIHYRTGGIRLKTCTEMSEMVYDSFLHEFNIIVTLSETLSNDASRRTPRHCRSTCFSFDMGIICPLDFVALKCRDTTLRQRALKLLLMAPSQDGIWYAQMSAQLASFVVISEENHAEIMPTGERIIPEWARIHGTIVDKEVLLNPRRSKVNIISKPDGLHGKWNVKTKWVMRP